MNRVWHDGDEKTPSLDENSGETQWEWDGNILYKDTWVQFFPKYFPYAEVEEEEILFLDERLGNKAHPDYEIDLTNEKFPEIKGKHGAIINYGVAFPLKEDINTYALAKMVKAFLVADYLEYNDEERWKIATGFLERYDLETETDESALLYFSNKFLAYLNDNFSVKKGYRKYPIRYFYQKRLFETVIDFVVETEQGLVIIQNSGFVGDPKKQKNKALELTTWLHFSKKALLHIFPKTKKIRTLVHFVMDGTLVAVETGED